MKHFDSVLILLFTSLSFLVFVCNINSRNLLGIVCISIILLFVIKNDNLFMIDLFNFLYDIKNKCYLYIKPIIMNHSNKITSKNYIHNKVNDKPLEKSKKNEQPEQSEKKQNYELLEQLKEQDYIHPNYIPDTTSFGNTEISRDDINKLGSSGDTDIFNRMKSMSIKNKISIDSFARQNKYTNMKYLEDELNEQSNRSWWDDETLE